MLLTCQFKSLTLSLSFFNGSNLTSNTTSLTLPKPVNFAPPPSNRRLVIKAMKTLQGKVVCATSDKTVAVEVTRLAPHPKYKRLVRHKKRYQAHDESNQFKVGDVVQLGKGRPVSKKKTFWAVPVPKRPARNDTPKGELGIPLESQSDNVIVN